ncbi:MAG: hypothetical protein EA402_09805 [Planctomycetota bacterium]|nr:MAG: hypothetical protein EA402_09805 [Planctomycetota bacterium]
MYSIYKLIRKFIKALVSDSAPWQVAWGVAFGCLLGFLPFFSFSHEFLIAWPAILVLVLALVVNVHLGSVFLFLGLATLIHLLCYPLAEAIGGALDGFAQTAATVPLLHAAGLSHTGWLGMTVLGFLFATIAGLGMWRFTVYFRSVMLPRLQEQRRLMAVGKVANKSLLVRGTCWFFGV